jgi:hypothetical protein
VTGAAEEVSGLRVKNPKEAHMNIQLSKPKEGKEGSNLNRGEDRGKKREEGVKSKHLTLAIGSAMRRQWRGLCA